MSLYTTNKNIKRVTSFVIVTSVLLGNVYPIFANGNTAKEEVIYAKLKDNGSVDSISVVNSFDLKNNNKIVDHGDYEKVVNLSTSDKLNFVNGSLSTKVSENNKKFYYQGDMKSKEIPWNISLNYYLDGKNIKADDLAGKSGNLKIDLVVKQNENVDKVFYDNYALQIALTLDSEKCKNVIADGGTIANAGSKKTITYIKLAGNEGKYTIKADVKDFEMDPISFNGINMNMNVDIDVNDMTDPLNKLVDAIKTLNSGTGELKNGVEHYKNGVNTLDNGISTLQNGISAYKNGADTLYTSTKQLVDASQNMKNGVGALQKGVNQLDGGAQNLNDGLKTLSRGSQNYKQSVNNYSNSVNQVVKNLKANLTQEQIDALQLDSLVRGAQNLASGYENIDSGISSSASGASSLNSGLDNLSDKMSNLSDGSNKLYSAIDKLSNGSEQLANKIGEIGDGASSLKKGSNQLVSGIDKIGSGATSLNNGTDKLNKKTSNMPKDIDSKIDDMVSKYANSDFTPVSFASKENTNVNCVQFAIRNDAIEIKEASEKADDKKPQENAWQLFLNLFKKDK